MSRIRTIKPSFFIDEDLSELTVLTRLLFIGLWTLADSEGRLEDRPKRIRVQIHPYDDGNTDAMLQSLHDAGFIIRYQHGDGKYIQVVNFRKHQRITGKEADTASQIPPPSVNPSPPEGSGTYVIDNEEENNVETTGKQLGNNWDFTNAQEGKGREGKGKEVEDTRARAREAATTEIPSSKDPDMPFDEICQLFKESFPASRDLDWKTMPRLRRQIEVICQRKGTGPGTDLDRWRKFFEYASHSAYLRGERPGTFGRPPFDVDLDWMTNPNNFEAVRSGKYHDVASHG